MADARYIRCRLGQLRLKTDADRMHWHFRLYQDVNIEKHAGFTMALLVANVDIH